MRDHLLKSLEKKLLIVIDSGCFTRLTKENNTSKNLLQFTEKSSIFHPNRHTVHCTKRQRTMNIPFTVFTKTCFSLVGSFSSTSTPWKMRPNVPVKEKNAGFYLKQGAGETRPEASHANVTSLTGSHVSADLRTEINKALLKKMLCLLMGLDSPGSCQREKSQTESFVTVQRVFYDRKQFRYMHNVERLLCMNFQPTAASLFCEVKCHLRR